MQSDHLNVEMINDSKSEKQSCSVMSNSLQPNGLCLPRPLRPWDFSRQGYWSGVPLPSLFPYMTTGKTKALSRRTFVGKVMSLLFNMLSRLIITFLPRSKHLLISWLQPPSSLTVSIASPSICHEVMGPDAMTLVF